MTVSFGKYQLIAELGHGGMGDVYLALAEGPEGTGFTKLVVIKRLRPHLGDDPEAMAMLLDEARLAARLNHPNLVQTNEVGKVGDAYFIAMEFLEGQPLHRLHVRGAKLGKRLPFLLECRLLADVLAGLHHAHELKDFDGTPLDVIHRDVTPHNVFVTYEGIGKVVDFGIAKAARRTVETKTGVVKGKITYMAPEQALTRDIDRRVDVFAVGAMLYEAATGRRLWDGLSDVQIAQRVISGNVPRSPRAVVPAVPDAIEAICARALAPKPQDRYPTAAEMQNDLEAFLDSPEAARLAAKLSSRRGSSRELGRFVSDLFAAERERMRVTIEQQLSAAGVSLPSKPSPAAPLGPEGLPSLITHTLPPPGKRGASMERHGLLEDDPSAPTVVQTTLPPELARIYATGDAAEDADLDGEVDDGANTVVQPTMANAAIAGPSITEGPASPLVPELPPPLSFVHSSPMPSSTSEVRPVGSLSEVRPILHRPDGAARPVSPTAYSQSTLSSLYARASTKPWKKRAGAIAASVAVLGGAIALVATLRSPTAPPDDAVASAEPSASAAPSASAPVADTIVVTVRVSPVEAKLTIDDAAPVDNPFLGRFPRDHRDHAIHVEANGYAPKDLHVTFDADVTLDLKLEQVKSKRSTPTRTTRTPRHKIDTTDPWH